MRRKDPEREKALAIQKQLLEQPVSLQSLALMKTEFSIIIRVRGQAEAYHERRGTRDVSIHAPKAAKAKYEVPYFFSSKRGVWQANRFFP